MKILYTGLQAENYNPKRKYSFEYTNFYLSLKGMPGVEVIEQPFERILEVGKKKFNAELLETVEREKPDLLFAFMYTDELDPGILEKIAALGTKTVGWFADDYWRFFSYSRRWAKHFSWIVTTSHRAAEWYKQAGIKNVILSQWACNTALYQPREVTQDIPISFVGQYKPARAKMLAGLAKRGINVEAYGFGWPNGRVSQEEMLTIISRSKITLNLNVRAGWFSPAVIGRIILKKSVNRLVPDFHLLDNLRAYAHFPMLHLHARPFELAGTNAFVISGYAEGMENYYVDGREMVFYNNVDDLAAKIRYYLLHDAEREAIRKAGYERTIREHTYQKRFEALFEKIGLNYP